MTTRGEPIAQGATTLRASEGMVHPLGSGAPGEERFLIEAPQKIGSGAMHLAASAVDVAPEPFLVLEKRVEAVIPLVAAPAERLTLSPSTDRLIIGDDAAATITVEAARPPRQPGVLRRAVVTVDGQPVALKPDGASCGQLALAAPAKPSRRGSMEVEARLGQLRAHTFIRVTPGPAVRLAASVSSPAIVGDGKHSVEVRIDAFDKTGRPASFRR